MTEVNESVEGFAVNLINLGPYDLHKLWKA
jgi:hypothetical protein